MKNKMDHLTISLMVPVHFNLNRNKQLWIKVFWIKQSLTFWKFLTKRNVELKEVLCFLYILLMTVTVLVSISYLPGLWAVGCPLLSSLPLAPLTHSQRLKPSSRPEPARAVSYRLDWGLWSPPEPPGRIIKIEKLNTKHLTSHLSYISPPLPPSS